MTGVVDVTERCCDGRRSRLRSHDLTAIWIHRIGPQIGRDAIAIAQFFTTGPGMRYTGANVPYHYINTYHQVEQALPLDERGAHARRWGNASGIGFAQQGDFRRASPSREQWDRAVQVCADIVPALSPMSDELCARVPEGLRDDIPIFGHGEVPGTYAEGSGKEQPGGKNACPGRLWSMVDFRQEVKAELRLRSALGLASKGHRLRGVR